MQEFNVSLTDKPGELAQVASAVGDEGINILGCVGMGRSTASVTMVTDDEDATKEVLKSMGRDFEVNELIIEFDHPVNGVMKIIGCPIQFSATGWGLRLAPPRLGEHNEEILAELGMEVSTEGDCS